MARLPVIALLGGGQLGRMFIENALRYGVTVHVLDPDPNAPCAKLAHRFVQGDLNDPATVLAFAKDAGVVGIEIEHVSVAALEELQRQGKTVVPDPRVLRTIQDKGLQKEFYRGHGIPTAPYALLHGPAQIAAEPRLLPAFWKARTGGYDGKGVMPITTADDIANAFPGPGVLEVRADIALELSVIVAVSAAGHTATYDPVEMVFDPRYNLVDHLRAPARIAPSLAEQARSLAKRVADAFGAPGIYAVEMFLTKQGELWVNETAPRAHNSGHHTIEACASSQFDQLLRTYLGWPLGDTALRGRAVMLNLVGEGGTGAVHVEGMAETLAVPGTFLHLYGKHETRTGRKMGHVTAIADDDAGLERAITTIKTHCKVVPATQAVTTHQ